MIRLSRHSLPAPDQARLAAPGTSRRSASRKVKSDLPQAVPTSGTEPHFSVNATCPLRPLTPATGLARTSLASRGEQFALPEAVGMLRATRRHPTADQWVSV